MKTNWNLDKLYKDYNDPKYEEDFQKLEVAYTKLHEALNKENNVEELLLCEEEIMEISMNLAIYSELRQAVDSKDNKAMSQINRLMVLQSEAAKDLSSAQKIFGKADIDTDNKTINDYQALLKQAKIQYKHLLDDEVESMISAMDISGGSAWGQLQSFLTSTLQVEYNNKNITLSEIRNLAYDPDEKIRKEAYEAEIKAYKKIEDSIAFSLNNIKNQVSMLAKKRGYESPLELTLENSRMSKATLDAMLEAIKDYMPKFRKYLRHKGELLGDKDGLKFYNLFAPIGSLDKKYDLEECKDLLVNVFKNFTPELSNMMKEAFENEWIDFYPKSGKSGGAFCCGVPSLKESRILTNYDGTFSAVDTLAHELGHAYHDHLMNNERIMNMDTPMPVAETASTFNETFLGAYFLQKAQSREERLALLENDLREKTQCVIDIYSRFYFEDTVFKKAKEQFLMADDLCDIMKEAQELSYGDGLDKDYRHPYMWACKSHYYSSGLSYYNFPYAFGNLFAQGLYALYLKNPADFLPKYREMLRTTGVHSIEECGKLMGIDLTKKDFWNASLAMIAEEIEEFCNL